MSWSMLSGRAVVALLLVLWKPVTASSTPFVTQVASPGQHHDEPKAAESKTIDGFMEDIGFSSFFQDVGVEAAASSPSFTKIMPAASNNFPSVGNFNFDFGSPGEQTKEQRAAMKEQGFMPTNPFGSSSNLASSNIAPPDAFKSEQSPFGDASGGFKFPAFETDFGFSGGFGSLGGGDQSHAPVAKEEQREKPAASAVTEEHRPRGKSASRSRPKFAQRREDTFSDDPYQESRLYASPSTKEEKKNKEKCEKVHKDGMTCEICNDGHGGFSEHCSHSQNSGKDSKFTNTRKHTSDDVLKPKEAEAPAPAYQQSQQRRVQQKQRAPHGGAAFGGRAEHPSDPHSAFDFSIPSSSSAANHQPVPNPHNPHNHYNSAQRPQPVHHQQPAPQQQFHPQQQQQQQQQLHHNHQQQQTYHPQQQQQQQQQLYHPETSHRSTSAVEVPAPSHQNTHQNQAPRHAVAFQNHNQQHQQYQQQPQQGASHVGQAGSHPSYSPQNGHHAAAHQPLQPQSAQQRDTQHNPNTYHSYQQPQLHQNRQPGSSYPQATNTPVHQPAGSNNPHQQPPSIHHGSQPRTTDAPAVSDRLPPNYHRFVTVQKDEDAIVPHPSQESLNTHPQKVNYQQQPPHPQQQQYHHNQQHQPHHQREQSNKAVVHQPTPNQHQQQQPHQQPQKNYNQHDQQHHVAPRFQNQQQEHPQQVQPHHHRSFSQKGPSQKKLPAPVSSHSPQENDAPSPYQSNEIKEIHTKDQNRKKFKTQKPTAPHHDDSNSNHDGGSSDHHQGDPKSSNEENHGGGDHGHRDEEGQGGDGDKKKNQGGSQNDFSDSDFDFDLKFRSSFGSSPYAQSQQDNVYNKASDPFEGFGSDPFDHFAEGSNTDPYKFDIPEFDESEFHFGPEDHKKLVKKVGIHDEPKQTSNKKTTRVQPTDHRQQSGSQQTKVAEKNLGYQEPNPKENYKQLGQMVNQFGKKSRSNCKKEIRKGMTCYICPNPHGKTDEECMFASADPHSQHMMYTEESSYGDPAA